MRVWLLFLVLTLGLGLIAGALVSLDAGYVLLSWKPACGSLLA